jgi:hypothetical protein
MVVKKPLRRRGSARGCECEAITAGQGIGKENLLLSEPTSEPAFLPPVVSS